MHDPLDMHVEQAEFPIRTMARVLRVSASGFYAWRARQPSARAVANNALLARICTIHSGVHAPWEHLWRPARAG